MRHIPVTWQLSALIADGTLDADEICRLGTRMADYHACLPAIPGQADFPATEHLRATVMSNLEKVRGRMDRNLPSSITDPLADYLHAFLSDSLFRLCKREQDGHLRERHGALHKQKIVPWLGELMPFDGPAVDPELHWIDTMSDVALLFLDLMSQRRPDLSYAFLNGYLSRGGDYEGIELLRFYAIHHAWVRSLVALPAPTATTDLDGRRQHARQSLRTATTLLVDSRPYLVIMHGPTGAGKSWLSGHLAERLGALRIRADAEAKRLPLHPGAPVPHGAVFDRNVYSRLLNCAKYCVQGGMAAIIDASFLEISDRHAFMTWADIHHVPFLIVSCHAGSEMLEARTSRRSSIGTDPAEAGRLEPQRPLEHYVPLSAAEEPRVVNVDTLSSDALQNALLAIRASLFATFTRDSESREA